MAVIHTTSIDGNDKPNILWLVAEDLSPHLGCYGDTFATTPNIDRLASQSLRYVNCWSNAPVCAPARTALLMGILPPSLGAQHMRSEAPLPATLKSYPELMREQGYFTTNNSKTDYNVTVEMKKLWDQNGNQAHWKNRAPGQPFLAVFNFEITHESQLRNNNTLAANRRHDPARVRVPAYHPDAPEVRKNWAQSYDRITQLDDQIQQRLNELNEAGLTEETIIFFYGDHGSGMPRSKRTALNTGLNMPLVIHFPEKYKHLAPKEYAPNGVSERLVSFIDFAPTLLSLAGAKAPGTMQGKPFAGKYDAGSQPYIYGFRGRMDERYDASRSIRDDRYVLAINLYPHLPYGHHNEYMFQTQTTQVWKQLYDEGKLQPEQAFFFELKPPVELYDLKTDPDQVRNLAGQREYREIQNRLLNALQRNMMETRDIGFLPEAMFWERTKGSSLGSTPYELAQDANRYDFKGIASSWFNNVSGIASNIGSANASRREARVARRTANVRVLNDRDTTDDAVRYWVGVGLLYRLAKTAGPDGSKPTAETRQLLETLRPDLEKLASDEQWIVRIPVAEALGRYGTEADVAKAEKILIDMMGDTASYSYYRTLQALNALDYFRARITDPEFPARVTATTDSMPKPTGRASQTFDKIIKSVLP